MRETTELEQPLRGRNRYERAELAVECLSAEAALEYVGEIERLRRRLGVKNLGAWGLRRYANVLRRPRVIEGRWKEVALVAEVSKGQDSSAG